jgi:hypothetical protein
VQAAIRPVVRQAWNGTVSPARVGAQMQGPANVSKPRLEGQDPDKLEATAFCLSPNRKRVADPAHTDEDALSHPVRHRRKRPVRSFIGDDGPEVRPLIGELNASFDPPFRRDTDEDPA